MCSLTENFLGITKGSCSRGNFLPELKELSNNSVIYTICEFKNVIFYMAVFVTSVVYVCPDDLSFILCMCLVSFLWTHYNDVKMGAMASQITSLAIIYSTVHSDADQRKHRSSAPLAFVRGIHRWPANSPHKCPVTRKCFHLMTSSCDYNLTGCFTICGLYTELA